MVAGSRRTAERVFFVMVAVVQEKWEWEASEREKLREKAFVSGD